MNRSQIVKFIVTCLFILLSFVIFYLEVIRGEKFGELSDKNCVRLLPQEGCRGRILDREDKVIVDSQLSYDLYVMPGSIEQLDTVLRRVDQILGVGSQRLKETYKNNFISTSAVVPIARNIDLRKAIALEELKTSLDGIVVLPRPQRAYPYANLAAHILGYINEIDRWRLTKLENYGYKTKDMVGFGGIEEKYDYYLRQDEGGLSIEVDSRGKLVRALGLRPPQNGKEIKLTLNLKIQQISEECLGDRIGAVVIMDPYSGEIIALVSSPGFNPAAFTKKDTTYLQNLFTDSKAALLNRAISGAYPAGSIFKMVVAAAALELGKITPATTFFCPGKMQIGKSEFGCWDTHSEEDLTNAIAHSCNVYFYHTGLMLGGQTIHDWAGKFGFSKPTNINLPYETAGFVPNPLWRKVYQFKNWYNGDTLNFSIGQGELLITPLQAARMISVFANGGFLVNPYIVKEIDSRDLSGYYKKSVSLHLKPRTIDAINKGLRGVVSDVKGTANVLSNLPVAVAGKTGSAQAPPGLAHGWFVGYFPYKQPKFAICVFLERGGAGYYAAVVARQIIERMSQEGLT